MTDRIRKLTVVLDKDYRDDDAEEIISAIGMIKCVAGVEPHVVDGSEAMNREVAKDELRRELGEKFNEALLPSWLRRRRDSAG